MHIYITGFMGVGKTTFGKKLAKALALPFIDTDELIEKQSGKSIETIFEREGEDGFRKLEATVLRSVNDIESCVISTGGGLPCYYDNMAFMNQHGLTVYLKASPSFIFSRLSTANKPRPLIKSLNQKELLLFITRKLSDREVFYSASAVVLHLPVKSPETLVKLVVSAYEQKISKR